MAYKDGTYVPPETVKKPVASGSIDTGIMTDAGTPPGGNWFQQGEARAAARAAANPNPMDLPPEPTAKVSAPMSGMPVPNPAVESLTGRFAPVAVGENGVAGTAPVPTLAPAEWNTKRAIAPGIQPSAEKIATQAQLGQSNANDAAQRNLTGADAFNAPTGVNAASMAAMKEQFNRMNAGSGTGPTRTPSLHADENLAGVPKLLTIDERRKAGIGWKTANAMYKEQMDAFQSDRTNKSALQRELVSQEGATGRTGMQEAGATNRTGMQNASAALTTGMHTRSAEGIAAASQAGENQRLGTTIGANKDLANLNATHQARGAANQLMGQAIIQGVNPANARVDVGGNNELQTNNLERVAPRGEQETFTSHPVADATGTTKIAVTGNKTGSVRLVDPTATPAGNNLTGQPQTGASAQTATPVQDYKKATEGLSPEQILKMGQELRRTNPEEYQNFRNQVR